MILFVPVRAARPFLCTLGLFGAAALVGCSFDSAGVGGTALDAAFGTDTPASDDADLPDTDDADLPSELDSGAPRADAAPVDAGKDAKQGPEAGIPGADSGPLACSPKPLSGTPAWSPPSAIHQNVCTLAQVKGLNQACFGADSSGCQAFVTANGGCSKCIVTQSTDARWGPLVDFSGVGATTNIGGCIAAAVTPSTSSDSTCGADVQRAYGCELSTCAPCESVSHDAYLACTGAADRGACSPWAGKRDTCLVHAQKNNAARCLGGPPDNDPFINAAMLFCGSTTD